MIMHYKLLIALLLILIGPGLFGQVYKEDKIPCIKKLPEESISLVNDRDYYLSGDQLWFKAFIFVDGEMSSDWSKVLYLELFNNEKEVFAQEKYLIEEGMADGVLQIPEDIYSGNYFLRAYTQYGRNFPVESLFSKVVSIVNPQSEPKSLKTLQIPENADKKEYKLTGLQRPVRLELLLSKLKYKNREKINLVIDNQIYADLAVSVRKKGTAHSQGELNRFLSINSWLANSYAKIGSDLEIKVPAVEEKETKAKLEWVPEMRGLTLMGEIHNKITGKAIPEVYCITSVIGKTPQLHMTKTNTEGMFIFPFGHLEGDKDIFVAIRNNENSDLEVLINSDFSTSFPEIQALAFPFDSSRHLIFEELFINKQLSQIFKSSNEKDAYQGSGPLPLTFNIGSPDIILDIQDFIYIPTMLEVFRELVPTVSVRGKIGSRKLYVFDEETFRALDNPLVLLDNVPVSDIENLLLIEPGQLDAIEVFNSDYLLGDYTFGGIISLRTNTNDFAGFKWTDNSVFLTYKTLQPGNSFQMPDYNLPDAVLDPKADFRTLLYWNPKVSLNGNARELMFYTSDHLSEYEIFVYGYTKEGIPCYGTIDFEVLR